MPKLRYSTPVSAIQPVHQGMGGVTGANADLPSNLPEYVKMHLTGVSADTGKGPGHNPNYGSVGNHGTPVKNPPLEHKTVPIRRKKNA